MRWFVKKHRRVSTVHFCLLVVNMGGSVGHLLCVCCCSDDETGTESLNLCISDELALFFISHHHILQLGTLSLSCQTLVPSAHTGMHMGSHVHIDPQTHPEAHVFNTHTLLGIPIFMPICRGTHYISLTHTHTHMPDCVINGTCSVFFFLFVLSTSPHQLLHLMQ